MDPRTDGTAALKDVPAAEGGTRASAAGPAPCSASPDRAPGAAHPRPYTFRRALGHSSAVHLFTFLALFLTGVGEPVERPRRDVRIVFEAAAPRPPATEVQPLVEPDTSEPERALVPPELPDPELRELELDPPEPLRPEPEPELAELDPLEPLSHLPLEPLPPLEPPEPEVARAEPPEPAPPPADTSTPPAPHVAPVPLTPERLPPLALSAPAPTYPRASIEMGHQGDVLVRIHVAPDGSVVDVELVSSSGYERLDEAALATVRRWRFRPATEGGLAVADRFLHRLKFRLEP